MKINPFLFRFKVVICIALHYNLHSQINTVSQLPGLIKITEEDSIQKIERLAALKFHEIINNYRQENKLEKIAWDEAMWLTCRNHNFWMGENSVLEHVEKPGTKLFTGTNPGDRYKYATMGKGHSQWSGENALYNFNKKGGNINEIASNIALISFEQWKHSSGHNSNMLGKRHKVHGVAFYLCKDGRVYGTDLFASNIDNQLSNSSIQNQAIATEVNCTGQTATAPEKRIKIDMDKIKNDLINKLYSQDTRNKAMEKASGKHSEYMCSVKQLTHNEIKTKKKYYGENEEARMIKATHGFFIFKKHKTKLVESIAMVDIDASKLDINKLATEIQMQLNNNQAASGNKIGVGYGVSIKRSKNNIKCYVTRVVGNKAV